MNEGLFCWPIRFSAIRTTRRRRCNRQWSRSFRILPSSESDRFKQWAMLVIENEAKMYRRKRRQHLYESLDQSSTEASEDKPFYPKQFADWRDLPSDAVAQKEVREAVAKALAELPDIYRAVFVLRDMQHLDVAETAEALS